MFSEEVRAFTLFLSYYTAGTVFIMLTTLIQGITS